jgi:LL-diaminopimelate aminotransferase
MAGRKIIVEPSDTVFQLPEPLGGQFDGLKRKVRRRNIDIIDLGKIDIRFPESLKGLIKVDNSRVWGNKLELNRYEQELKNLIAEWLKEDYQVSFDPEREMLLTTGNTPGLFTAFMSLLGRGDKIMIPEPAFSLYRSCARTSGAEAETYSVSEITNFLPNLEKIKTAFSPKNRVRALLINYPHNPTARGVDLKFYNRLSEFALKNNLIIFADSVYLVHGSAGFSHPMYLQSTNGLATGLEFITFSFIFNLPDFKIGVALGHRDFISPLARFRSSFNLVPSMFDMEIAMRLLKERGQVFQTFADLYSNRRELVYAELDRLGWEYLPSGYAPFVWIKLPHRRRVSMTFCRMLLKRTGVVLLPGTFFGEEGEGFARISLGQSEEDIKTAFERINNYSKVYKAPKKIKPRRKSG